MTVVVLGWDGLDGTVADRFGLADQFGATGLHEIETITNPVLGKPHTWELWPSIITGLPPDEHGIHAEDFIRGSGFDSQLLNVAAEWSAGVIPEGIRWRVGKWLRDRGASFDFHRLQYYRDNDIPTVLDVDGVQRRVGIGIPNCRTLMDECLDIAHDRGAVLSDYLQTTDNSGIRKPTVDPDILQTRLTADMARKIGAVRSLVGTVDLVFVWLAYLDTMGHVSPTVSDPDEWQQTAYETAANYTDQLTKLADRVICVSDHGLQNGQHTDTAWIGASGGIDLQPVSSVLDVADIVEGAITDTNSSESMTKIQDTGEVEDRLIQLGYIE